MRNRWSRLGLTALVFAVALQSTALADAIEGRVVGVRPGVLSMTVYDEQGRPYPNTLSLAVDRNTQLDGFSSISQLGRNDAVGVQVHQRETGVWYADRITLFQSVDVQPATRKASPSLKDALGNPVVRGALLGAVTGAIAAKSSKGKAGKGALVGAGVGAAAGLFGDLFGSSSKSAGDSDQ